MSSCDISPSAITKNVTNTPNKNVLFSLRPIYIFSRIFGLMPFSIIRNSNYEIQGVQVGKFDLLWFIISISLYSFMAIICFQTTHYVKSPINSVVIVTGDRILLTICLCNCVIKVVMDMCNRFRLIDIMKKFAFFDNEVSKCIE